MFCDDQVIGMIEIDADATWAPAKEGVVEDLFSALQDAPENSTQLATSSDWTPPPARDSEGEMAWYPAVPADLEQLDLDLRIAYDRLLDRLMSVSIS